MMVHLLQRNYSLQVLDFFNSGKFDFEFDWSLFTQLLCNTSTIESTYLFNHNLRAIVNICGHNRASVELCSLMHLNRETDKLVVAREKILRNHNLDDVHFVSSSIPLVLSALGNTRAVHAGYFVCTNFSELSHILPAAITIKRNAKWTVSSER
jgi:hypothetical protein